MDRTQELLSRLSTVQKISLTEAMAMLDISESTARRLFATLEQRGSVIRIHGGIQSIAPSGNYSFEDLVKTNVQKKIAIGNAAVQFLEDGDVLFCDSGTTMQCFCAQLILHLQKHPMNIKIYTNSLANLELLAPHMPVNLIGGEYRTNRKDFCGPLAEKALSGLYFTKSFVGADGCVHGRQFTTTDFQTARINETALRNARRTFLLVDSSKFTKTAQVSYTLVQPTQTIITDTGITEETRAQLSVSHARLICVDA